MIVNEKIYIKLNQQLKNSLGEKYKKYSVGETIEIFLIDLSKGSNLLIDAKCDKCGELLEAFIPAPLKQFYGKNANKSI